MLKSASSSASATQEGRFTPALFAPNSLTPASFTPASPAQKIKTRTSIPRVLVFSLALAIVISALVPTANTFTTSAQKRKPRPAATQRPKAPAPKATPTPNPLDALGEPPPWPTPSPKVDREVNPGDVISVETTEVMLPVSVRDAGGRLVTELTRKDFRVFEDDREQPLSELALRQTPVDVVLMVDASSSAASNLDDFRRAVQGFAATLAADDRVSLIKFDDRVVLLQDWTQSRFQLQRALNRITSGMFTRFNDALMLVAKDQFGKSKSRRAVIILSDGIDNNPGGTAFESAVQTLLQAQATVYVVSNTEMERAAKTAELASITSGSDASVRFNQIKIDDLREGLRVIDFSEDRLAQLTAATGGKLYKPHSFSALEATYAEVAEELRHQYALYYSPTNKARDGSFRRVRVETVVPSNKATTRVGYFAPRK